MRSIFRKVFGRNIDKNECSTTVSDEMEWFCNPAVPYHIDCPTKQSKNYTRDTKSCCTQNNTFRRHKPNRSTRSVKNLSVEKVKSRQEQQCGDCDSVDDGNQSLLDDRCWERFKEDNQTNDLILKYQQKLSTYQARLKREIEKKERYKEQLIVERELREATVRMYQCKLLDLEEARNLHYLSSRRASYFRHYEC